MTQNLKMRAQYQELIILYSLALAVPTCGLLSFWSTRFSAGFAAVSALSSVALIAYSLYLLARSKSSSRWRKWPAIAGVVFGAWNIMFLARMLYLTNEVRRTLEQLQLDSAIP